MSIWRTYDGAKIVMTQPLWHVRRLPLVRGILFVLHSFVLPTRQIHPRPSGAARTQQLGARMYAKYEMRVVRI